jgi:hypothetical protein
MYDDRERVLSQPSRKRKMTRRKVKEEEEEDTEDADLGKAPDVC